MYHLHAKIKKYVGDRSLSLQIKHGGLIRMVLIGHRADAFSYSFYE